MRSPGCFVVRLALLVCVFGSLCACSSNAATLAGSPKAEFSSSAALASCDATSAKFAASSTSTAYETAKGTPEKTTPGQRLINAQYRVDFVSYTNLFR